MTANEQRFTDRLRAAAEPDWSRATGHRFTEEMGAGTLDPAVCARYLVQDYAFVDAFVSLLGHAVALAPSMVEKRPFAQFLAAVTSEENDYFLRSFEALEVPPEVWRDPARHPVTEGLLRELEGAGTSGDYAEVLAVLLAAEWSYLTWAKALGDARPQEFWLAEWIDLHAVPEFEAFVTWLREETDRVGATAPPETQARMEARFVRMMALEVAFFDAAYEGR